MVAEKARHNTEKAELQDANQKNLRMWEDFLNNANLKADQRRANDEAVLKARENSYAEEKKFLHAAHAKEKAAMVAAHANEH